MEPLAIIEPFDKRKDLPTGFLPRVIPLVVNEFILQRAEETLGSRVIITVALPTHARRDAARAELLLIGPAAILSPSIRVMDAELPGNLGSSRCPAFSSSTACRLNSGVNRRR